MDQHHGVDRWKRERLAILDLLAIHHLHRAPTETLSQFFARARQALPHEFSILFDPLMEATDAVFYGHYDPVPKDLESFRVLYETLMQSLRRQERMRLALVRAFVPLSHRSFLKS